MNRNLIKKLKIITIILIIILILEIIFTSWYLITKKNKAIYFDGINAIRQYNETYVTVGSNNNNSKHYEKAKLSLYNSKKEKTSEVTYNIGYNSAFFGVTIDEGGQVCVGSYEKDKKDRNNSTRHALIVKYDKNGKIIFSKNFSLLDNSKFTNIVEYNGYYYVTGQSIYTATRIGTENGGAIICKYDKNGKLIWNKSYGNSKNAIYNDLIIYNDNIYAVGGDDNLGIITKYDLDGNIITQDNYKNTANTGFTSIVSINNNIYTTTSSNNKGLIVMYDNNCNYIKSINNKNKIINKLIADDSGDIIGIGSIYKKNKNNHDGVIMKINSNLEKIDSATYGDEREDYFTDIIFSDNKYIVSGYSSYEDGSYMSKFINYSKALKVLEVE